MSERTMEELLAYVHRRKRVRRGNRVKLLTDGGEIFSALRAAIRQANDFVHMEFYIWRGDKTGWSFADLLREKARAGVTVRVMYDAWGSMDVDPLIFDTMRNDGVIVTAYKPLSIWRPGILRRDHRKIVVIDNRMAFVGGINIADDYASVADGGAGWRDSAVALEGPTVTDLNRLFVNTWHAQTGADEAPRPTTASPVSDSGAMVVLLANSELGQRRRIVRSYLHAIKNAKRTIYIANAYFLPTLRVRNALHLAAKRGVDVRVIVPAESDVRVAQWASGHLLPRLVKRGVRILQWTGAMIHAKIACIDGVFGAVGSYNLDHRSLRANLEVNVVVVDREFGASMDEQFVRDFQACREVTLSTLARRTWLQRLRDWFFYQFRSFM